MLVSSSNFLEEAMNHLGEMYITKEVVSLFLVKDSLPLKWVIVEENIGDFYEVIPFKMFGITTIMLSRNEFQSYVDGDLDLPEGWEDLIEIKPLLLEEKI